MTELQAEPFGARHVLDIAGLNKRDAETILETANAFFEVSRRAVRKVPTLRGKTVINGFFEPSTRTRTSFEIAGKRLSADVINVAGSSSSITKGESLLDTCRTLQAMQPDVIVIRHGSSGAAEFVAQHTSAHVINAGDGMHAHPTQALLDAFTLLKVKGTLENLVVTICGDIAHSRVARSNIALLRVFGAKVRVVAPRTLLPAFIERLGVEVFDDLEPALNGADVVMALRIQKERLNSTEFPTLREYSRVYGITAPRLSLAKPDAVVMHPGPMNRGVEIAPDVADGTRSLILNQVEAGVAVRMAILYLLTGDTGERTSVKTVGE
ncbi:MAG: aspartate carbamoyltransferase catalytic subunit [Myxococcales bacterium]|nr:aspartate carbamoyltransferase catalytic subunit [Myxococcales bacterium]